MATTIAQAIGEYRSENLRKLGMHPTQIAALTGSQGGYSAGGTRTKSEGAVFKRLLKTTHTLLGSKIKDVGISEIFSDVYDGQATFFPIFERDATGATLTVGELSIGNTRGACKYLIESPVHRKPLFGSGELFGLDLNIYHDNIDFNQENTLPDMEVYKFKGGLGTVGTFGAARVDDDGDANVMCGSMSYNEVPAIIETFDGVDPITVTSAVAHDLSKNQLYGKKASGQLYITLDDAYKTTKVNSGYDGDLVNNSAGVRSKGAYRKRYAQKNTYNGEYIVHVEQVSMLGTHWYAPNKGRRYSRTDAAWNRKAFDYWYNQEHPLTGAGNVFQEHIFHTKGNEMPVILEPEAGEEKIATINTDKTIFEEVHSTGDTVTEIDGATSYPTYTRSYFSSEDSPPSGSAWKQDLWWHKDEDITTQSFAGNEQEYQTSMAWLRLPKPLRISRKDADGALGNGYQVDSMEVDIKFSILAMNKYHRSDERAKSTPASYGHNLLRSFVVIAATRPPRDEALHSYLSNLTATTDAATPTGDNPYILEENSGTSATGTRKNNYNAVAFIRHATTENAKSGQDGALSMYFSGTNHSVSGTARSQLIRGGSGQKLPHIGKTSASTPTPIDTAAESGVGGSSPTAQMSAGEYYTLKMIINYKKEGPNHGGANKDGITWVLLNSANKIMASRRAGHGGNDPTGILAGQELDTNEGAGFPSYLSFWVNNAKVGIQNEQTGTDAGNSGTAGSGVNGLYLSTGSDSQVKVAIDSISIYGFEGSNRNVSVTSLNRSTLPLQINPETTQSLIDTDGTFTVGEEMPTLMGTNEKSPIANYIMWGTKSDILSGKVNNIFMGGMTSGSPSLNTACTFAAGSGDDTNDSDIVLIVPDNAGKLGSWNVLDRNVKVDIDPHHNDALTLTGTNYVDTFTKKGFFTINFLSVTNPANYVARECPAFSTKITKIISKSEIKVANKAVLMGNTDEEYVIYRAGQSYGNTVLRGIEAGNEIKIKEDIIGSTADGIIKLQGAGGEDVYLADDDSSTLLTDAYLHELYISPKRFWFGLEIFSVDASTDEFLPSKTYSYSLIQQGTVPGDSIRGMTFNEELYSDTSGNSNRWNMDKDGGLVETGIDFGYGARSEDDGTVDFEESSGYIQKYVPKSGFNAISLDGLVNVEGSRLNKPDEKINLFLSVAPEASGSCAIRTTKYVDSPITASDPYFTFYYFDERPILTDFKVIPYEDDPFYPHFTWSTQDEDLWYGFLLFSNKEIKHQYDGAVAHIPLNETSVTTNSNIKLYRYDGTYSGTAVNASDGGATYNLTTVEGLSGNAFKGNGGTSTSWVAFGDSGASTWTHPTNELSVIAHFTCDSVSANRYVLSKLNEFEIYIDTSGNINALVKPQGGTAVTLKSTSIVVTDGETPMNTIITLDRSLATGNVKLFINGKLEDQSGQKLATGTANNWHDANLNDDSSVLTVGKQSGGINYHSGTIEEVVIYNKCIYPVVPQTGVFTLYKPYAEFNPQGNPQSGITNVGRLFVKDYHNIRGTLSNQITASSMVSWRKSGLGLKSI